MAETGRHRAALMSLHPEFVQAILEGRKKVEFRRVAPSRDVTHVVIYATHPTGKVVGFFEVEGFQEGSPTELWERFGEVGGVSHSRFRQYFRGRSQGVAILVRRATRLSAPVDLSDLGVVRPPQSFMYLSSPQAEALLRPIL